MHAVALQATLHIALPATLPVVLPATPLIEEATAVHLILQTVVGVVLILLTIDDHTIAVAGPTLHIIVVAVGHTIVMTATGHIPGLAPLTAGHLSACVTDHILPVTQGMTQRMIATTGGTIPGSFLEVSHPGQGGQGEGVTHAAPLLLEEGGATHQVCLPG